MGGSVKYNDANISVKCVYCGNTLIPKYLYDDKVYVEICTKCGLSQIGVVKDMLHDNEIQTLKEFKIRFNKAIDDYIMYCRDFVEKVEMIGVESLISKFDKLLRGQHRIVCVYNDTKKELDDLPMTVSHRQEAEQSLLNMYNEGCKIVKKVYKDTYEDLVIQLKKKLYNNMYEDIRNKRVFDMLWGLANNTSTNNWFEVKQEFEKLELCVHDCVSILKEE